MPTLSLAIDARRMAEGAAVATKATEEMAASSARATRSVELLQAQVDESGQGFLDFGRTGRQGMFDFSTGLRPAADGIDRLGDTLRRTRETGNAFGRDFQRNGGIATRSGNEIANAFHKAGVSIVATGGDLRGAFTGLTSDLYLATTRSDAFASSIGISAGRLAAIAGGAAGVLAIGAALASAAKNAMDLEKGLRLIIAQKGIGSLGQYEQAARDLAMATGATQEEAQRALTQAVGSGFESFASQVDVARRALTLTRTAGVEAAQGVAAIDSVLNVFNLDATHTGEVVDKLVVASTLGKKPFADFAGAAQAAGARLSQLGFSLDETLATLTFITPSSANATQSGNSLANIFSRLTATSDPLQDRLAAIGYTINADTVQADGMVGTLLKLAEAVRDVPSLKAELIPEPRDQKAFFAALDQIETKGQAAAAAIANAAGAQRRAFENVAALPSEQLDRMQEGAKTFWSMMGAGVRDFTLKVKDAFVAGDIGAFFPDISMENLRKAAQDRDILKAITSDITRAGLQESAKLWDSYFGKLKESAKKTSAEISNAGTGNDWDAAFNKPPPTELPVRRRLPNLPSATSPLGPEFDRSLQRATIEAETLARSLQEKLGDALVDETSRMHGFESQTLKNAAAFSALETKLRNNEIELRKKIDSYNDLNRAAEQFGGVTVDTEPLEAALFALVQADNAALASMKATSRASIMAADSASIAGHAWLEYSQNVLKARGATESLGLAQFGALRGVVAMTETVAKAVVEGRKAFEAGIGQHVADYQFETSLIGKTADEQERLTALRQFDIEVMQLQKSTSPDVYHLMIDDIQNAEKALERAINEKEVRRKAEMLGHAFADPIGQGVDAWINGMATIKDVVERTVRSIIANLAQISITGPLQNFILGLFNPGTPPVYGPPRPGSFMGNVISGGSILPFSMGGIPDIVDQGHYPSLVRGPVIAHALGGLPDIGNRPAFFSMTGGRTGSLREGGKEEAIMPVGRTASGELGVKIAGGTARGNTYVTVQQYISTPDVRGFRAASRHIAEDAKRSFGGTG